ncbi:hypothetical protein PC116_g24914 [Phytophthora cactorum]|uniref:Uncharacterized protein n=4 Tax=Phytophthora cactorum TaxID=29920 RepID=A0A8T0Y1T6_9STRA|nr:hypothetical protein Pcac1_g11666 [Phytophthora cactorum]KAG2798969.1 hypothetical protein PC111_g20623 [Phytophthora cactorum]KAG2803065.1 hypothetical protein PC112_g19348 [Phytophthora cactorum]KAG2830845.1 hypothetical protein PC113_g21038 [Phytophthora cactorum]KAG2882517.1 hypothetical protein PC114_g20996 [Phytophthora cactorum]
MNQEDVEVFSKETFLTSVKRISDSATGNMSIQNATTNSVDETPAMAIVRQKHAQLHDVVGSLSEKISSVLARQERDFLAAYRAHMYNVQKELHEMREKIHRNETVENKSEKIKKIEDERDWYRKEALRLDAFTTTMTKDLKYMKENLESIEEDRNWLEKQLKACKKQNKLLRAELDVRLAVPSNNSGSDSAGVFPAFGRSGSKILKHRGSQDLLTAAPVGAHGLPQLNLDVSSASQEREEKFKKQIRSLKRELQHKSSELISIKRHQRLLRPDGGGTGQSPLEKFFLQCVDSVKEEVGRRRDCRPSSVKAGQRGSRSATEKPRQPRFDVELDDFTPNDRVRLIERLLAHDEVLSFLYNHLFPSEKPAVNTDALEMSWSSQPSGREIQKREESLPTLHSSVSLPDTTSLFSNFDGSSNKSSKDGSDPIDATAEGTGAGPGVLSGSLPLDFFTKQYLKSVKPAFVE